MTGWPGQWQGPPFEMDFIISPGPNYYKGNKAGKVSNYIKGKKKKKSATNKLRRVPGGKL